MENKKPFENFIGPAYEGRSHAYDSQETINMYIEVDETKMGKNSQPAIFIGTPGLKFLQTIGPGPIRGTYTVSNQLVNEQYMFVVSGNKVFKLLGAEAIPVEMTGTLNTSSGPVSIADNGNQVVIVDGQFGYYIAIPGTTVTLITSVHFYPADTVTFQDGYLIFNRTGTNSFFISDLYDVTFPALNETAKTGNSDLLVSVVSISRQLYLLGTNTTEIWWNQGASGSSPFARQEGRFSQVGCASPHSIAVLAEQFYWLGSNAQGTGIVYTIENSLPKRISTHAVEYDIQNAVGNIGLSTAFAYQSEGHYFYCLNVPGTNCTWVYDAVTQQWHKREDWPEGVEGRWYAETHCLLNDVHIVGDYRNGNIYQLDLDTYTDNGDPKYYIRQTPHIAANLNNVFYHLLEVDFQFGVGLVENGTNVSTDPRVTLYISNDGGLTWKNPIYAKLGKIGKYLTRARFDRLGYARDRVFKVVVTEATKLQMLMAMMDIEIGAS
jgi:hypothetical protein